MSAAFEQSTDFINRFEHGVVFVHVALRGREVGGEHPLTLLAEMALGMLGHGIEMMRQLAIRRCEQGVEEVDELAVGCVHRAVAEQELVGPDEVLLS